MAPGSSTEKTTMGMPLSRASAKAAVSITWSFRAIAHHRINQPRESRQCLEQAAHWIMQADRRKTPDVELTKPCWKNLSWHEHAAALRMFAEAQALINQSTGLDPQ